MRLTIESLAYGGAGVAKAPDGFTVFVEGSCPGDVVDAQETERHERYARARIVSLLQASSDRVEPACPHFGECGGCQWQHVAYTAQCTAKAAAVESALAKIGGAQIDVDATAPSPDTYGYRNKVEFHVRPTSRGPLLGLARRHTNDVVPIQECLLLPPALRRAPRALGGALRYLSARTDARVDRVALRVSRSGEVTVDVWTDPSGFPRQLAAKVFADAVGASSVTRVIAKGPSGARRVTRVEVLLGEGVWHETLSGDRYSVSPPSFFQVNTRAAERLRSTACAAVEESGANTVADVYAGVGTFTLPLARFADVVAVESSSHALADLRRNLAGAALRAEITPGDAGHVLGTIDTVGAVLIDPPRTGLSKDAGQALLSACPKTIVYVSCDPATLARDAKLLISGGYSLRKATPIDLFPQTYHIETVVTFVLG
ncbi:MAG: 23S rRNA (uracil(1939)-C(5))-methyltransferase RlmD [Coriobacteriales bacterium]